VESRAVIGDWSSCWRLERVGVDWSGDGGQSGLLRHERLVETVAVDEEQLVDAEVVVGEWLLETGAVDRNRTGRWRQQQFLETAAASEDKSRSCSQEPTLHTRER
jgi:hypothetical protein